VTESITETVEGASRGVVTGRSVEELGGHIAVVTVRVRLGTNSSPRNQSPESRWARVVDTEGAAKPHQPRSRGQPRWTLHTIPARVISRGPPRGRSKQYPPHSSHKSRREAAHVRINSVLPDGARAPIGNR
jgi:hypothetical protein